MRVVSHVRATECNQFLINSGNLINFHMYCKTYISYSILSFIV